MGDFSYIDGLRAAVRLRMGDLERARADLEQAEHAQSERCVGLSDAGAWLAQVRADLHWREGDGTAANSAAMTRSLSPPARLPIRRRRVTSCAGRRGPRAARTR